MQLHIEKGVKVSGVDNEKKTYCNPWSWKENVHAVYLHVLTEWQIKVMSEVTKLIVKFYMA